MKLLLRFKDLDSLIKYLDEELNKLKMAKQKLEKEIEKESLVDIVEMKGGNISIRRDRITEFKGMINEINARIEIISSLLEELRNELKESNYTGLVLLEFDNGVPRRVLLSQPLTLGESL